MCWNEVERYYEEKLNIQWYLDLSNLIESVFNTHNAHGGIFLPPDAYF